MKIPYLAADFSKDENIGTGLFSFPDRDSRIAFKTMRLSTIIIFLTLATVLPGLARGSELSSRAAEYLKKLERFEAERASALKIVLQEKRVQVLAILEKDMQALTRKGDLEGALAAKSDIEALSSEVDLTTLQAPVEAEGGPQNSSKDSLIGKLETFEFEKAEELKAELREKRGQVAEILEQELQALTKQGNLEGALAVKAEIERLNGEIELVSTNMETAPTQKQRERMPEEEGKKALEEFLTGRTLLFSNEGYAFEYNFERRGEMERITNKNGEGVTEVKASRWEVVGANVADVIHSDGAVEKFTFTSDTEAKKEFFRGDSLRSTFTATLKESE